MTRPSKRELERTLDSLDSQDGLDLSGGFNVVFDTDETPDRDPDVVGDGFAIYADRVEGRR